MKATGLLRKAEKRKRKRFNYSSFEKSSVTLGTCQLILDSTSHDSRLECLSDSVTALGQAFKILVALNK